MTTINTNSNKLAELNRVVLISMLSVADGEKANPEQFKGKRSNTLAQILEEKIQKDNSIVAKLTEKNLDFGCFSHLVEVATPVATKDVKQASEKTPKLLISEMTPEQIMKSLTPKQQEAVEKIVKACENDAMEVHSHRVMPEAKDAWSFGGVVTTLIEKGVITRSGSGTSKKFHIAESFKSILK